METLFTLLLWGSSFIVLVQSIAVLGFLFHYLGGDPHPGEEIGALLFGIGSKTLTTSGRVWYLVLNALPYTLIYIAYLIYS